MKRGLDLTHQFLAKTGNRSVLDIYQHGLDSKDPKVRARSVKGLLARREPEGHRMLFDRLETMNAEQIELVRGRPDRLVKAATESLQSGEMKNVVRSCRSIVKLSLYELFPSLTAALSEAKDAKIHEILAGTISELAECYYASLSGLNDVEEKRQDRRDRDSLRARICSALETSAKQYHRHQRKEPVEAYLMVVKPSSASLRTMFQQRDTAVSAAAIEVLQTSEKGGVVRLLLAFLEDPRMPKAVAGVISNRMDPKFIEHVMHTVAKRPSKSLGESLSQFGEFAWAKPGHELFEQVDGTAQEGAVRLLTMSGMTREKVLDVLAWMLREGKPEGRRAAAESLERFPNNTRVDELVIRGLADPDAFVRAACITQLRPRKIPNALSMLVRMVEDDMDETIRTALHRAMPEFTFRSLLSNHDSMDDQLRSIVGNLVRRLDRDVQKRVLEEMYAMSPVRRRRAVSALVSMGMVAAMEDQIVKLLADEDHMVRVAAAQTLGEAKSIPSWQALRAAMFDRSAVVQEAAERSLQGLSQSLLLGLLEEEKAKAAAAEADQAADEKAATGELTAAQAETSA